MPINLAKGQKVDLTKGNPGLKSVMVGLGWDVNTFNTGADLTLMLRHFYSELTLSVLPRKSLYFTAILRMQVNPLSIRETT